MRELDQLDILVNNAAFQEHVPSLEELTDEQLERTFRTNIYGYFYMARAALPHLKEGGAIINTGSVTGLEGSKELLDYSGDQGRHPRLHQVAGPEPGRAGHPGELRGAGAGVDAAQPGGPGRRRRWRSSASDTPMKRPAQPEEIAPAYVFFAAPVCSSYITGEVLPLLGGETVG